MLAPRPQSEKSHESDGSSSVVEAGSLIRLCGRELWWRAVCGEGAAAPGGTRRAHIKEAARCVDKEGPEEG